MAFSVVVIVFGAGLDLFFYSIGAHWSSEVFVENILTGIGAGIAAFGYMEDRRRNTERRLEEISYLNHHIRNALAAIQLARYTEDDDLRLRIIDDASSRIEKTIRKVSEQEHVTLEDGNPQVP